MKIEKDIPLKKKNWFETGGNAEYFVKPEIEKDFQECLNFAKEKNLKITILGKGANVLISDDGVKGLVISPSGNSIEVIKKEKDNIFLKVDSGVILEDLINFCLNNKIIGLEEFSGIPGSVGGALYINIHYFNFLISQFVCGANILDLEKNEIIKVENDWFEHGYNKSKLLTKKYCLINAIFKLNCCSELESEYAKGRSFEIVRHRKQRYPYKGTCGSFFRNFYENEVTLVNNGKKIIFSAFYLDKIGVKGTLSFGDAIVSYKHSNMIVNKGNAESKDIVILARKMQELVWKNFGILLNPECEFLGFESFPLFTKEEIKKNF